MRAGVIGVVDGDFDVVGPYAETVSDGDHELDRSLEIDRVFSLPSGERGFEGHAAAEKMTTETSTEIADGEIRVVEQRVKTTVRTEFAGVVGEFLAVDSSKGSFAFDLVGAETGASIDRAALDLSSFLDAHRDGTPWKAGFYDKPGNAQTGTVYGTDLLRDEEFGTVLADASLNQLGIDYEYRGDAVKVDLTESGFVQVHRPTEFETDDFLQFLADELEPVLSAD